MSDVYMPGVKSRFNSEDIIDKLMRLERVPKERTEKNIDNLQTQKGYWQEVGRRINTLRESARFLYSFQNPFNERIAVSTNEAALTATATREAEEQSYNFTVKQTAQADRFLSFPLDEKTKIEAGNYAFTVGNDKISINFRGGSLKDFVEVINRRGNDKISANLIAVQSGTKSLLIESKKTGSANKLDFQEDAAKLALKTGMVEQGNDTRKNVAITENSVNGGGTTSINDGILKVGVQSSATLPVALSLSADSPVMLKLETSTRVEDSGVFNVPQPPPGPAIPKGSVTYGGITVDNEPSSAPLPEWKTPEVPQRRDDMSVLSLVFSDGTSAKLPPITDSGAFVSRQYVLSDVAQGRTISSLKIENNNTHREVSVGKIEIFDPTSTTGGYIPQNALSTARDAIITMEGIEILRPTNSIDDLIPGLTLNVRGVSDRPVELKVKGDTEKVKESIINFVGNYNRLLAEINVLTARSVSSGSGTKTSVDDSVLNELTYLTAEERAEMRERLGAFNGDLTLNQLKNRLLQSVTAPYPTSLERDLSLLAQIGIGTNAARGAGYEPSKLRGYLDIDEKKLDSSLETKIPAIKELFASDTSGDMIADTGVAYNVDSIVKPFVETGGIITLKTNTIDSRITQDERRINTMERQLAAKEQELKIQYARMEAAYARMESMSTSLDNFNQQNRPSNR
jgi:flagellar hook-associated protein 2